jgi:hypothetical protein
MLVHLRAHHRRLLLSALVLWTSLFSYVLGTAGVVVNRHGLLMAHVRIVGSTGYDPSTTSTTKLWKVTVEEAPNAVGIPSRLSNIRLEKQVPSSSLKWMPLQNEWVGEGVVTFVIPFEPSSSSPTNDDDDDDDDDVEMSVYSSRTFILTLWQVDNDRGTSPSTRRLATLPRVPNSLHGLNPVAQVTLHGASVEARNSSSTVLTLTTQTKEESRWSIFIWECLLLWGVAVTVFCSHICISISMRKYKKQKIEAHAHLPVQVPVVHVADHRNTPAQHLWREETEELTEQVQVQVQVHPRYYDYDHDHDYSGTEDSSSQHGYCSEEEESSDAGSSKDSVQSSHQENHFTDRQDDETRSCGTRYSPRSTPFYGLQDTDDARFSNKEEDALALERAVEDADAPDLHSSPHDSSQNLSRSNLFDDGISSTFPYTIMDQNEGSLSWTNQQTKDARSETTREPPIRARGIRDAATASSTGDWNNDNSSREPKGLDRHDHDATESNDRRLKEVPPFSEMLVEDKKDYKVLQLPMKSLGREEENSHRIERLHLGLEGRREEDSSCHVASSNEEDEKECMRDSGENQNNTPAKYNCQRLTWSPPQELHEGLEQRPVTVDYDAVPSLEPGYKNKVFIAKEYKPETILAARANSGDSHFVREQLESNFQTSESSLASADTKSRMKSDYSEKFECDMNRFANGAVSGSVGQVCTCNHNETESLCATLAGYHPSDSKYPESRTQSELQTPGNSSSNNNNNTNIEMFSNADTDPVECSGSAQINPSPEPKARLGFTEFDVTCTVLPGSSSKSAENSAKEPAKEHFQNEKSAPLSFRPSLDVMNPQVKVACGTFENCRRDNHTAESMTPSRPGDDSSNVCIGSPEKIACSPREPEETGINLAELSNDDCDLVHDVLQNEHNTPKGSFASFPFDKPETRSLREVGSDHRLINDTSQNARQIFQFGSTNSSDPADEKHIQEVDEATPTRCSKTMADEQCASKLVLVEPSPPSDGDAGRNPKARTNGGTFFTTDQEERATVLDQTALEQDGDVLCDHSGASLSAKPDDACDRTKVLEEGEGCEPTNKVRTNETWVDIQSLNCSPTCLRGTEDKQTFKGGNTVGRDGKASEIADSSEDNASVGGESYVSTLPPDSDYRSDDEADQFKFSPSADKKAPPGEGGTSKPRWPLGSPSPILETPRKRNAQCSTQLTKAVSVGLDSKPSTARVPLRRSKRLLDAKTSEQISRSGSNTWFETNYMYPRTKKSGVRKRPRTTLGKRDSKSDSDSDSGSDVLLIGFGSDSEVLVVGVEPPPATKKARPFRNSSIVPDWVPSNGLRSASRQMEDQPWDVLPESQPSSKKALTPPKSILLPDRK